MEVRPASMASAGNHYRNASLTTVVSLSSVVPAEARHALISVEGNGIRLLDTGETPTASIGFPIAAGSDMLFSGDIKRTQIVSQTGTAVVTILWYR